MMISQSRVRYTTNHWNCINMMMMINGNGINISILTAGGDDDDDDDDDSDDDDDIVLNNNINNI